MALDDDSQLLAFLIDVLCFMVQDLSFIARRVAYASGSSAGPAGEWQF